MGGEDPEDKKARLLERKMATLERRRAAEDDADDLTTDLKAVYSFGGLPMLGTKGTKKKKKAPEQSRVLSVHDIGGP